MTSPSALLLGLCSICGEPIVRHRLQNGRQISCEAMRQIDQALQASGAAPQEPVRDFQIVRRASHRDDQGRIS